VLCLCLYIGARAYRPSLADKPPSCGAEIAKLDAHTLGRARQLDQAILTLELDDQGVARARRQAHAPCTNHRRTSFMP